MPSVRELKARLSHYIAESRAGYAVEITAHRRPVARLTGLPAENTESVTDIAEASELQWGGGKPRGLDVALPGKAKPLSTMVVEDRG